MKQTQHSWSSYSFRLGRTVVLFFICLNLGIVIPAAGAEQKFPPGFIETLDRLELKPDERELLLKQKPWAQELAVKGDQKEINALLKLLKKPGTLKFACMAPLGTTWAKYIKEVPKIYREKVGNIVHMESYIGLSLGNDADYVRKMAAGALETAGMTSWGMKYISKEMGVYELPFLFETYGEADYVIAKTWPYFVKKFEEKGFTLVPTNFEIGFLQIFSIDTTVKLPGDLKTIKYGSWMGEVEIETLKHLGVKPVVITVTEVPSSLATGIIRSGSAPAMYMVGAQLTKFRKKEGGCSGINMFYPPGGLVYKKKNIYNATLSSIPRKERKYLTKYIDKSLEIFDELLKEVGPKMAHEMREGNKKLIAHLQKQGMPVYKPSKEERETWKKATRSIWDQLAGKVYSREILDMVLKYKAEYRAEHPEEFENYEWAP